MRGGISGGVGEDPQIEGPGPGQVVGPLGPRGSRQEALDPYLPEHQIVGAGGPAVFRQQRDGLRRQPGGQEELGRLQPTLRIVAAQADGARLQLVGQSRHR